MKTITTIMALAISAISLGQSTWGFDKSHSSVQFDIDHMVISEVSGSFKEFDGMVKATKEDFSDAQIEFTIQVKSVNTDNADRDKHLRSPDFFDAEKYETIKFKSTSLKKVGEGVYKMTGNITMHGVTKKITLDVSYGGTIKDPYGNMRAGFKIMGTLNRTDFGLVYNSTMETGGLLIGEEVSIVCKVELIKKQ